MAGARIVLGGEIDVASGKELEDTEGRLLKAINGARESRPIYRKIPMAAGSATGPDLLASPAVCPQDKEWHLVKIALGIDDDHTTLSGASAALYVANNPSLDLLQCEIPGISPIPYFNDIGEKRVIIHPGQTIYIVGYGITAGHQIWATLTVAEHLIPSVEAMYAGIRG